MHASKYTSIDPNVTIHTFATAGMSMEWEYPFGTTYNGMVALQTALFMHKNGVTPEEMASIPVAFRKWAELDPNAMHRKPLTIEKVAVYARWSATLCTRWSAISWRTGGGVALIVHHPRSSN
jgi:acetyl-CoA C-acetyltransferase